MWLQYSYFFHWTTEIEINYQGLTLTLLPTCPLVDRKHEILFQICLLIKQSSDHFFTYDLSIKISYAIFEYGKSTVSLMKYIFTKTNY